MQQTSPPESVALLQGTPLENMPRDLYIPPDALEVILADFSGPLDLLLYLIKKQNIDILNIPVADIARQYSVYIDMMQALRFELAAEYLVMSAMLAEIKSRLLLPSLPGEEEDEADPRAELIRRLQAYEYYKQAAEQLDQLPRQGRDVFITCIEAQDLNTPKPLPEATLAELTAALQSVLQRVKNNASHHLLPEVLSVRERMSMILKTLKDNEYMEFERFFNLEEGRMGVVVTFAALLELIKQAMVDIIQTETYGKIHIAGIQDESSEAIVVIKAEDLNAT